MIYEFLFRETSQLEEQLNKEKATLLQLEVDREENKKFSVKIEESVDRKYAGFTPYDINQKEDVKLAEIKQTIKCLEEDIQKQRNLIADLEKRVVEYKIMTQKAKVLEETKTEEK